MCDQPAFYNMGDIKGRLILKERKINIGPSIFFKFYLKSKFKK